MFRKTTFTVLAALLMATLATAQLAVMVQPTPTFISPAQRVDPIEIMLTESSGRGVTFLDSCIVNQVRAVTTEGPIVWEPSTCQDVLIWLPPHGVITEAWYPVDSAGCLLPAEQYMLRVSYLPIGEPVVHHQWVPVKILAPLQPALIPTSLAGPGGSAVCSLSAPCFRGDWYFAAAALTTQVGVDLGTAPGWRGLHLVLDQDFLFDLSFPQPQGALFTGWQGQLDDRGFASGITFHVPDVPALEGRGFTVQAVLVPSVEGQYHFPQLSNPVSFTIFE